LAQAAKPNQANSLMLWRREVTGVVKRVSTEHVQYNGKTNRSWPPFSLTSPEDLLFYSCSLASFAAENFFRWGLFLLAIGPMGDYHILFQLIYLSISMLNSGFYRLFEEMKEF
jgi:hypothetical protein